MSESPESWTCLNYNFLPTQKVQIYRDLSVLMKSSTSVMRWDSKLCRKLMDNSILATGAKIVALVFLSYLTLGNWIAEQYYLSHVRRVVNLGLSKYLLELLPQGSISLSNLSSSAQQNLHWPLETSFTKPTLFLHLLLHFMTLELWTSSSRLNLLPLLILTSAILFENYSKCRIWIFT